MKLVENIGTLIPNCIILTGDGRRELEILRSLSKKYNGHDLILFFPFSPLAKKTGVNGLDALKTIPIKYLIDSIIYIVDGEFFEINTIYKDRILNYLKSIGVQIVESTSIADALLINCKCRGHKIDLYCIISGPTTFIEEEIARLIDLQLHVPIDLSGTRDNAWKARIKSNINQIIRENNITIEKLIEQAGKGIIEKSFPNICAVFKKIEENFQI